MSQIPTILAPEHRTKIQRAQDRWTAALATIDTTPAPTAAQIAREDETRDAYTEAVETAYVCAEIDCWTISTATAYCPDHR